MKGFYAGTGLVLAILVAMSLQWRGGVGEINSFYGVVDTAETVVSAELPVEIVRLRVASGQLVREGDTLVDLISGELERNIAELRHSLNEARVARITEDREIEAQVAEFEAQYKLNRSLLSQVRGGGSENADEEGASPLRAAITGLKGMLAREEISTVDMEAYLSLLLRERDKLTVIAPGPGVIGTVHRRLGERVKAFEPVLTLYTGAPVTIRGYLHESAHGLIENGQSVRVRSIVSRYHVMGQVVGIGHRIVEYPVRLRKFADVQMWGREVIVRIPDSNAFLLGEKVMIDMLPGSKAISRDEGSRAPFPGISAHASNPGSHAMEPPASSATGLPTASSAKHPSSSSNPPSSGVSSNASDWVLPGVEASGLVYLARADRFLVVSDDTPKKRPLLYSVTPAGTLGTTTEIQGLQALNDMESITQDASGRLYIATSQSRNKAGKFPETRRKLVRLVNAEPDNKRSTTFRLDASVPLHDVLAAAARDNASDWAVWFRAATEAGTLDMEGLALQGDGLLLGFKAPLWKGRAMIVRIGNLESLWSGRAVSPELVSVWDAPVLKRPGTEVTHGISDLFFHEGVLHVLGTAVQEDAHDGVSGGGGGWWIVEPGRAPRLQRAFPGMKPEGIAFDPGAGAYRIALDEGSNKASRVLLSRPEPR